MIGAEKWSLAARGGAGSDGQNGGRGADGRKGADAPRKMTRGEFETKFPSMAVYWTTGTEMATVKKTLSECLKTRTIDWKNGNKLDFFVEGWTEQGQKITVSRYQDYSVLKHCFYLIKGVDGTAGQRGGRGGLGGLAGTGGYNGTIIFQDFDGKPWNKTYQAAVDDQGASGKPGTAGEGGLHGQQGKASGDVGFKGWVNGQSFCGFDGNWRLDIEYRDSEFGVEPVWCLYNKKWANFVKTDIPNPVVQGRRGEKNAHVSSRSNEAIKKKAILQRTIANYAEKIGKHARMQEQVTEATTEQLTEIGDSFGRVIGSKVIDNSQFHSTYQIKHQQLTIQKLNTEKSPKINRNVSLELIKCFQAICSRYK